MGGKPVTAMAIAGMPNDLPLDVIKEIFRGGADKVVEAGCSLVGGHTIKNPEPIYGLSVTGMCHPEQYLSNDQLKEGDILILSKPLGTGIASSALKSGKASEALQDASVKSMVTLNLSGATIAERKLSRACTDVTGFGLLGHLWEMCRASGVGAQLDSSKIPVINEDIITLINEGCVPGGTKANLASVTEHVVFDSQVASHIPHLLADAQTAGGLLIAVSEENIPEVLSILEKDNALCAEVIGKISSRSETPKISVS